MDNAHKNIVKSDLGILDGIGLDENSIVDINSNAEGKFVYKYQLTPNTTSDISVSEELNGVLLDITEGYLHNQLLIDDIGDLYLDGFKIDFSNAYGGEPSDALKTNYLKTDWSSTAFTNSTPYSTSSSGSQFNPNLSLGQTISKITVAALVAIISIFQPWIGIAAGVITSIAGNIKTLGEQVYPNATFLSYKLYWYDSTKSQNYIIVYTQYKGTFWMQPNYTGTSTNQVAYRRDSYA